MKETMVIIFSIILYISLCVLVMPWLFEYGELYFEWVRSHFNN